MWSNSWAVSSMSPRRGRGLLEVELVSRGDATHHVAAGGRHAHERLEALGRVIAEHVRDAHAQVAHARGIGLVELDGLEGHTTALELAHGVRLLHALFLGHPGMPPYKAGHGRTVRRMTQEVYLTCGRRRGRGVEARSPVWDARPYSPVSSSPGMTIGGTHSPWPLLSSLSCSSRVRSSTGARNLPV